MGNMKLLNPNHIRITCECGEFFHEVKRAEDGSLQYEEFKKERPQAPVDANTSAAQKKKGKRYVGLFETEGDE